MKRSLVTLARMEAAAMLAELASPLTMGVHSTSVWGTRLPSTSTMDFPGSASASAQIFMPSMVAARMLIRSMVPLSMSSTCHASALSVICS